MSAVTGLRGLGGRGGRRGRNSHVPHHMSEAVQRAEPGGGRDFPTTSVLTITPGKDDDGAQYRCVVWNRALTDDEKMESTVTLSVNYYPRITIGPENPLRVELEHSATLTCTADAKPAVSNVRWTRAGRFIDTHNTLVMERISLEDAGRYVCQADNGLGRLREAEVTLDVQYGPRVAVMSSKDVDESEDIMITCNVTANPAPVTIEWLKEGDDSFRQNGDILRLNRVSAQNQGNYICRAVNILNPTGGEPSDRIGNATVAVRVRHAPGKTFITPAEPIAVQGEQSTLTSAPTPRLAHAHVPLVARRHRLAAHSGRQLHHPPRLAPSNRLGKGTPASVHVRVYQPPRILENLPESAIHRISKTDLSLTCRAQGKPQPSIRWLKDGVELNASDGLYDILVEQSRNQNAAYTVQSTLQFRGPRRYDNQLLPIDRGTYQCVFKNDVREVSSSQLLRIEHSPITVHKANKVAYDLGEDARVECRMQAYPQPTFQWSLDSNFIDEDGAHYTTNHTALGDDVYASVLTVLGVTKADYGSYTCKGMNNMGEHKTIITCKRRVARTPKNLRVITRGTDFINLAWDESFNGGFPDTIFHVRAEAMSGEITSHDCQTQNPCVIQPLQQQTRFKLQVKASNIKGDSDFSDPLETMTLVNLQGAPTSLMLQAQVEVQDVETEEWIPMEELVPIQSDNHGEVALAILLPTKCESSSVPSLSRTAVEITKLQERRNSKLKNKTADMEVSHRGVVAQQAPPPPYYTVGMDNKGLDGSMDTGLDDPSKTGIYSSQQYHNYNQNGHVNNAHNNNGMGFMDNSYSNSNNGGSVNSQDSLWQVKGHGDPQMGSHMVQDPRSYQYDPMIHGGYGISGYDDYSHYPPASHQGQGMMEDYPGSRGNYMANGDPYAAVQKPRKRADHMDGSYDVSGMPDPYMEQHDQMGAEMNPTINLKSVLTSLWSLVTRPRIPATEESSGRLLCEQQHEVF
ncbi:putative hemicentin-1 [Penaeus vannamei]|uniref:Putative hemicentin-1 n=1 Tax=Penaeus vannamei TaxID=6689 RepID=A0A3R7PKF0_PENVA|nr:putative hemicentin-1 [Penaeus vannamei]